MIVQYYKRYWFNPDIGEPGPQWMTCCQYAKYKICNMKFSEKSLIILKQIINQPSETYTQFEQPEIELNYCPICGDKINTDTEV